MYLATKIMQILNGNVKKFQLTVKILFNIVSNYIVVGQKGFNKSFLSIFYLKYTPKYRKMVKNVKLFK